MVNEGTCAACWGEGTEIPELQVQERTGKGTFQLGEVTFGRTSLCENAKGDGCWSLVRAVTLLFIRKNKCSWVLTSLDQGCCNGIIKKPPKLILYHYFGWHFLLCITVVRFNSGSFNLKKKNLVCLLEILTWNFLFLPFPSTFLYLKFLVVWALVLLADFVLEFRFEYLWPFWLFIRSVYDSFRYQGLVSGTQGLCAFPGKSCTPGNVPCYAADWMRWVRSASQEEGFLWFVPSLWWIFYLWQVGMK